jgi:hypothetical protein
MENDKSLAKDGAGIVGSISLSLLDQNGNAVKLWNENKYGKAIRAFFSRFVEPIGEDGTVKRGLLNYLAAYGVRLSLFGEYSLSLDKNNLVVSAGKAGLASRLNGDGAEAVFNYLAVGLDNTAAAAGNTALGSEITDSGLERAAATASRVTTTVTNDTARLQKTWNVTGTKAVVEIGAFNAGSGGTMLGRTVFSVINVSNGFTLIATYDFQIT